MSEFLDALLDPDTPVLRYALLAGVLSSVALGIIGTYVVTRRISSIAGAISHSVLGGIGAALYLQVVVGLAWCDPMAGAVIAALVSALIIGTVSLYAKQREDTVIGALWSVGMAVGLLFFAKTPGYTDPMSYLFGNILMITSNDLWHVIELDVLVVVLGVVLYNKFLAVWFRSGVRRASGSPRPSLLSVAPVPHGADRRSHGARGGHRHGHRHVDFAGGRGRTFRSPTLADDDPRRAVLHVLHSDRAGGQLSL